MKRTFKALTVFSLACLIVSCGGNRARLGDSAPDNVAQEESDQHADLDIAMTVRSVVDALQVGQPLSGKDYDFQGVMTDGEGTALYSDDQGNPGEWIVKVESPEKILIYNTSAGNLLPMDLQDYITASLNLWDKDIISASGFDHDKGLRMTEYRIPGGTLKFENSGGLLTILLAATPATATSTHE